MTKRRKILLYIIFVGLISIIIGYACKSVWQVEPFFVLSLTNPKAPINELYKWHYALISVFVRTPVVVDANGNIYIVGRKNSKVKILVLNSKGEIKRIITPCLKDGRFLEHCPLISVSPSGNHIWTITPTFPILFTYCITVHDRNGKAKMDWIIAGGSTTHWLINAYSEDSAYGVRYRDLFRFIIGQKKPQKFKMPFSDPIFYNGKYWWAGMFERMMKEPFWPEIKFKEWYKEIEPKRFWVVVTWTPEEGFRLIKKVRINGVVPIGMISGIDQQGNFYCIDNLSLKTPIDYILSFLLKIKPLAKMIQNFINLGSLEQRVQVLKIVSPQGKILDIIPLTWLTKTKEGEELIYGDLVIKADKTGIYLEVEKIIEPSKLVIKEVRKGTYRVEQVNGPKEYRIVRIVKKRRWQVWLEGLKEWMKRQ